MHIASVILRTNDLSRLADFWSTMVGLEVVGQSPGFVFFDCGTIQLILNELGEVRPDASMTEVVFEVADIEGQVQAMTDRGVVFEVEPRVVTSDGARNLIATHFHDPDGHLVSITSWVAAG